MSEPIPHPPPEPSAAADAPPAAAKPRRRIPLWRKIIYLLLPFALLFGALAVIEGCVRLSKPHVTSLEAFVAEKDPNRLENNRQAVVFEGDPWVIWKFVPNLKNQHWDWTTFSTNDLGWRDDRPSHRKPSGAVRVVCIGDSVTFGFRVPLTSKEHPMKFEAIDAPYPNVLERLLRDANPGREIEVLNLGVPGYTAFQGLNLLRRDIGWLKPDVVIACFGWNDVSPRDYREVEAFPNDLGHLLHRRLLARSQAMIYLTRWLRAREEAKAKAAAPNATPTPRPAMVERLTKEQYVENLLDLAKTARRRGAEPLLVAPVYRDRVNNPVVAEKLAIYREALAEAAAREKVPYVVVEDLTESAYPRNDGFFGEEIHPVGIGMSIMANTILDGMEESGILKSVGLKAR